MSMHSREICCATEPCAVTGDAGRGCFTSIFLSVVEVLRCHPWFVVNHRSSVYNDMTTDYTTVDTTLPFDNFGAILAAQKSITR